MPAPGDEQAEVRGRSRDPLRRVGRAESPQLPARRGELNPELLRWRLQAAGAVGEVPGPDSKPGQVQNPVSRYPGDAQCIADVLAVPDEFHEPRASQRGRRHRRDDPRHAFPRRDGG